MAGPLRPAIPVQKRISIPGGDPKASLRRNDLGIRCKGVSAGFGNLQCTTSNDKEGFANAAETFMLGKRPSVRKAS